MSVVAAYSLTHDNLAFLWRARRHPRCADRGAGATGWRSVADADASDS